ncbi:MAG: lipoyl(octanoyl) transferase LipB [Candidatus Omnitrophica bacterium]|nr:lipoyl(octanoyl) transferase LipB [Candidatus Omnitrophota bacterium]
MHGSIEFLDLDLVDFRYAWNLQKKILLEVKEAYRAGTVIFCRHYPVITLGRNASLDNLLAPPEVLKSKNIELIKVDRGGDITYHGPGQIIVYPILNLELFRRDIHCFLGFLEYLVVDFLKGLGVDAEIYPGVRGVWIKNRKISSFGIGIKNWISFHGLSLNIKEYDLENFSLIRPCGMDIKVTSLENVLNKTLVFEEIKEKLKLKFRDKFCLPG